jgi:hypothetical protein
MPCIATGRAYSLLVQCVSEAADACETCCSQGLHDASEVHGALGSVGPDLGYEASRVVLESQRFRFAVAHCHCAAFEGRSDGLVFR